MKLLSWLKRPLNLLLALSVLIVATGVFFRIYNLTFPGKPVFDEVYFPTFALDYIKRISFYDVHPPMGKFVIAVGILLFGNTQFGWRIMPLIFGIGNIALMGYLMWSFFKDKVMALIMASFIAMDGAFLVYSRSGLMDGVLFFAIFSCLLLAVKLKEKGWILWCGILIGIATAIKWPAMAIILPMLWFATKKGKVAELINSLFIAIPVYLIIVFIGQVLIRSTDPLHATFLWNIQALDYHLGLTATHPWGSPWWSWPLLLRPVLFLYDTTGNGTLQVITTLGNPMIWWSATAAVIGSTIFLFKYLFVDKVAPWDHETFPLLVGYYALWLPWIFVHRVVFLYHYLPSYGFALMLLAYWLGQAWKSGYQAAVLLYIFICFLITLNYLPLNVGWIAVTQGHLNHLINVKSWLY